jgi:hypothetical protein
MNGSLIVTCRHRLRVFQERAASSKHPVPGRIVSDTVFAKQKVFTIDLIMLISCIFAQLLP